jgi:hypothetical protein
MNGSFWDFLQDLWKRFLVEVLILSASALVASVHWYFRGRLNDKEAQLRRLKRDTERRDEELDSRDRDLNVLQKHCEELESQLPKTALQKADSELLDNNDGPAHRAILDWFEKEGDTVSLLLFRRAEWVTAQQNGAPCRLIEPVQHPQQRALSRAARPDHGKHFASFQSEVHISKQSPRFGKRKSTAQLRTCKLKG